jgi:hypothetical protein
MHFPRGVCYITPSLPAGDPVDPEWSFGLLIFIDTDNRRDKTEEIGDVPDSNISQPARCAGHRYISNDIMLGSTCSESG